MDDFEDGEINPDYQMMDHPGEWVEEDGVIKQTNPAPGDHTYLVIQGGFPEPHTAMVKVRVDDWEDDDLSRTGLGLRLDPGDGAGPRPGEHPRQLPLSRRYRHAHVAQ